MFKTVLALTILLVVKVIATPLHSKPTSPYEGARTAWQEAECAVQGGMCQNQVDCNPSDIVRLADLCPQQSQLGVVCCYYF